MMKNSIIEKFKNSQYFNQIYLPNDYIMFAYIAGERLVLSNIGDNDADYEIVVVTGHTTDLAPGKMLMYHPANNPNKDIKISWIYVSFDMFTTKKNYFKYNYFNQLYFNDLFLYSIYFVTDDKLVYLDNQYTEKLMAFYKQKGIVNVKKLIRLFYQYNEDFVSSLSIDTLGNSIKYLYHFLMMSYIMNSEALTVNILTKIKDINKKAKQRNYTFDNDTKKYITDRLNLLISLCK